MQIEQNKNQCHVVHRKKEQKYTRSELYKNYASNEFHDTLYLSR